MSLADRLLDALAHYGPDARHIVADVLAVIQEEA